MDAAAAIDLNRPISRSGMASSRWEELRREATRIERDLDVKLSSYAKLSTSFVDAGSQTVGSGGSWTSIEMEIQSLLEKLLGVNDSMTHCASTSTTTASINQKLTRHRDILHEFTQEFRRIKGNLHSTRERSELLSSILNDIKQFQASANVSAEASLLRERAAIHGSISQVDEVISQAQTMRVVLGTQRSLLGDVQGKVKQLSEKFPIVRSLLGSIKRKRSKDTIILSAVIAACTLFLIIYWLSK